MNRNDKEFIVQKIRTQYMEKNTAPTELERLKALDIKVKRPANVFAYIFGSISAIIMGSGMSLVMAPELSEVLGMADPMVPGIVIGVIGLAMALINYPMHNAILGARKKKYAGEILALSENILNK